VGLGRLTRKERLRAIRARLEFLLTTDALERMDCRRAFPFTARAHIPGYGLRQYVRMLLQEAERCERSWHVSGHDPAWPETALHIAAELERIHDWVQAFAEDDQG